MVHAHMRAAMRWTTSRMMDNGRKRIFLGSGGFVRVSLCMLIRAWVGRLILSVSGCHHDCHHDHLSLLHKENYLPDVVAEAIHVDTSGCAPVVPLVRCYGAPERKEGKASELEELKSAREPNDRQAEEDPSD